MPLSCSKHCYPLSGLLVFGDGSNFIGSSAWGNTKRSTYYHNTPNKIRVKAEIFNTEAEKILRYVADNSTKFQKSIANYLARKESSIDLVTRKVTEVDARLDEIITERQHLDQRLSFLLNDDDMAMAQSFRGQYKKQFAALNDEERKLERKKSELQLLRKQLSEAQDTSKNGFIGKINEAISCIRRKDFVALRSIYRRLFEKIVVHPLKNARVELEFVMRNLSTPHYKYEVGNCLSVRRARLECQETKFSLNPKILIKSITCITYSSITEDLLRQKYLGNRLSIRDIAREFSYSKTRVRKLLLKHNIPLRNRSERYGSRWLPYGKRRTGGKIIDHKGELRTIATIKQMYADEISIAAIARFLNTMKIPTRRRRRESYKQASMSGANSKGWSDYMVIGILKREGAYVARRKGQIRTSA